MTLDQIIPFGDHVLVRPDPKHETSDGGLHIPQTVLADNPNYYTVSGVVVKLGDGYREDVYECQNHQCRYQYRRTVGEYCPVCKASQKLAYADSDQHPFDVAVGDRVLFGRFAGKQIEAELPNAPKQVGDDFTAEFQLGQVPALRDAMGWKKPTAKFLMMREVEILGILDTQAKVTPGYQAANFNKASAGLTPEVSTVIR